MIKNFNLWPSELFEWVEKYLIDSIKNKTIIYPHRWPDFANLCKNTDNIMRDFFNIPDNYKIYYTYSATESMEILIKNTVDKNITNIVNWEFWDLFVWEAKSLKKYVEVIKKNRWLKVEIDEIACNSEVLAITSNDTSTWIEYSPKEIIEIRKKYSDKIIIVDSTSSFWALNYDINSADAWLFSVQKNLWLPPWLWVIIVNEKIINKSLELEKKWNDIWWHHKLSNFLKFQELNHTPSTPNILLIWALWFVVNKFKDLYWNISNLENKTNEKSEYFYNNINLKSLLISENWKSKTTFVLNTTIDENEKIFSKLNAQWYSISPWYALNKSNNIRIANFPAHNIEDIIILVKLINSSI